MNPTTLIWSLVFFEILLILFVFHWMKRNDILVQISKWQAGVMIQESFRTRYKESSSGEHLIKMWDLFGRNKIPLKPSWRNYLLSSETTPFIGVKRKLKVYEDKKNNWEYWKIPRNTDKENINSEEIINFTNSSLHNIHERFQYKASDLELIHNIIVKGGILILALACLIFFPRIYEAINQQAGEVYKPALNKLGGVLNQFIPKG